jgi:hypothetical protein
MMRFSSAVSFPSLPTPPVCSSSTYGLNTMPLQAAMSAIRLHSRNRDVSRVLDFFSKRRSQLHNPWMGNLTWGISIQTLTYGVGDRSCLIGNVHLKIHVKKFSPVGFHKEYLSSNLISKSVGCLIVHRPDAPRWIYICTTKDAHHPLTTSCNDPVLFISFSFLRPSCSHRFRSRYLARFRPRASPVRPRFPAYRTKTIHRHLRSRELVQRRRILPPELLRPCRYNQAFSW